MDMKQQGPETRKFLKASRRLRRDSNKNSKNEKHGVSEMKTIFSKESGMHGGEHGDKGDGGGKMGKVKKELTKSVACPGPMKSKGTSASVSSSARAIPSSTKIREKQVVQEDILKQIMSVSKSVGKSFKIPKKKPSEIIFPNKISVPPPLRHENSGSVVVSSARHVGQQKVEVHAENVNVVVDESEPMECEDMDWETTIQEIKGFWGGSQFQHEDANIIAKKLIADTMDVDMVEASRTPQLIIVPDTNIWIHDTGLILQLLEAKLQNYLQPTILIPWMVLQELDGNKGRMPGSNGRSAINLIHKLLSMRHPRVKGQKASDAAQVVPGYDRIEDDSILQCAEQCQSADATVVLLTNDCNLRNKALVNNVKTCDAKRGIQGIHEVLAIHNNNNNNTNCPFSPRPTEFKPFAANISVTPQVDKSPVIMTTPVNSRTNIPPVNTNHHVTPQSTRSAGASSARSKSSKREISPRRKNIEKRTKVDLFEVQQTAKSLENFRAVSRLIEETLSYVIEKKMKDEYGDPGWLNAIKIPPPWTLKGAVNCIVKHWLAAFSEVFGKRVSVAEKLLKSVQEYDGGRRDEKTEEDIIENTLGLFTAGEFVSCNLFKRDPQISLCRHSLLEYLQRLKKNEN